MQKRGKRGNGEGSIYQRAGRPGWYATLTVKGRRLSYHGDTRVEAAKKLATALNQRNEGELPSGGRDVRLGDYLEKWLENRRHGIKPWTYRGYRTQIKHIKEAMGHLRLRELTPDDVTSFIASRVSAGASPRHVIRAHQCLRTALADAVRAGHVRINVASRDALPRGVLPKVKRFNITPFTADEARDFLAAAENDRLGPLYSLALRSGMRQGELLGLTWDDVDFANSRIMVTRSLQREVEDGKLRLGDVKSDSGRRPIELSAEAMAALAKQREVQASATVRDLEWVSLVFTTEEGKPLDARNTTLSFKRFLRRHGFRDMRFHDLRHTHASLLLIAGEHPKVVQERLGHSSIKITLDTYSHLIPSMQREAAGRLETILADVGRLRGPQ